MGFSNYRVKILLDLVKILQIAFFLIPFISWIRIFQVVSIRRFESASLPHLVHYSWHDKNIQSTILLGNSDRLEVKDNELYQIKAGQPHELILLT